MNIKEHNQKSAATWNSGGASYDDISRGIADSIEHAIFRLNPQAGEKILDLATGTGWTSRRLAQRGAKVTGVDIAEQLLAAARGKAADAGLVVEYVHGDAENLPFQPGDFAAIISTFGVMFVGRPEAAAAELARICKKGGRIALTTWKPDANVFKMFLVMKKYMPPPPNPPPASPFEWGRRERVKELLGSEFDLKFEDTTSFYREPSAEEAWRVFSTGYGPTRSLATSLEPDKREALRRDFIDFHSQFATELGICVPRDYLLTIGVRR